MDVDPTIPISRANDEITGRPGRIIVAFLLLTTAFGIGLGNIETQAGTEEFTEDIPAEAALQAVNQEFGPRFAPGQGSTQLIQRGGNVLAKPALLRMLRIEDRLADRPALRVTGTSSVAGIVARSLDPSARSVDEQIAAIEQSTPGAIADAVRRSARHNPQFVGLLSRDFNRKDASATATIAVVTHSVPAGLAAGAGTGGTSPLTQIQHGVAHVVDSVGGPTEIVVFGTGIVSEEFSSVIVDTLLIVLPAAVVLIVLFLVIAYRDLVDLMIGIVALGMALVWTFGFLGLAGIAFNQILVAVPPLVLAVGIDYGIHVVNRYREERTDGIGIAAAMRGTTRQLLVAFFIVTATTVVGFLANLTSDLGPIRDFGVVASIGIVFTFLIFGVFVPAAKVYVDRLRGRYPIPSFSETPLGAEGTRLGGFLQVGVVIARRAPRVFLAAVLLGSILSGAYATGIDTSFSQEDFLPPEETPAYLERLPEPFKPREYTVVATLHYLEDHFSVVQGDTVTVYLQGPMERDTALEAIHRAGGNPPDSFVSDDRQAAAESVISVIRSRAQVDPAFRLLIRRNDRNANGIPDDNLEAVYDALFAAAGGERAFEYLTEDRRAARVVYEVKPTATQKEITEDARTVADRHRFDAVATGNTVVFQAISDVLLRSAVVSLTVALAVTGVLLVMVFWVLEGRPSLGIANTVPILVTVAVLAGSMRLAGIAFNAFTATILAITIGLGIDYSVHVTHRFADEYRDDVDVARALAVTVRGTGGALTGSMLTTVFGIGVLTLAIFPAIGQFGVVTGLSILYSYLSSVLVLPSVLYLWGTWSPAVTPGAPATRTG